jgi:YHS domain-containing protein
MCRCPEVALKALVALGLLALAAPGCSRPPDPWDSRGDRLLGIGSTRAEDPVSGVQVDKKVSVKREYRGTTYYFESAETADLFMAHPSEYAVPESEGREGRVDVR